MLIDPFQRRHTYLRISLTDQCNLRCFYCMPREDHPISPASHLMTPDEIFSIARTFVGLGVTKIRLTGGEPLIRKDVGEILCRLSALAVELTMTTNGSRLHLFEADLRQAQVKTINISLDTLSAEKFKEITHRSDFDQVLKNIFAFMDLGYVIKINVVAILGVNDEEILDFIALTRNHPLQIRFIEFMPFAGNHWKGASVIPMAEILRRIEQGYKPYRLVDKPNDTAKNYGLEGHLGNFSIISTMSAPFCSSCNRLRITADGKMKNCLFSTSEIDLLTRLRSGGPIEPLIMASLADKAAERGGQFVAEYERLNPDRLINRSMIGIGG